MSKWYIYKVNSPCNDKHQLAYYKKPQKSEDLIYVGECEVKDDDYFIAEPIGTKCFDPDMSMYSRKSIAKKAQEARNNGDLELSGMLEWLIQLRYSWIRQVADNYFDPDPAGLYTPHRMKLKEEIINKHMKSPCTQHDKIEQ